MFNLWERCTQGFERVSNKFGGPRVVEALRSAGIDVIAEWGPTRKNASIHEDFFILERHATHSNRR